MQADLSAINDAKELKALAYDQIAAQEQASNNLQAINARLSQVMGVSEQYEKAAPKGTPSVSDEELGIEDSATKPDEVE